MFMMPTHLRPICLSFLLLQKAVNPALKELKATHPTIFGGGGQYKVLHYSSLKRWYDSWQERGEDALKDMRGKHKMQKEVGLPRALKASVDDFLLSLLAQKMEVTSKLLRPFVLAHIKTTDNGKWARCLVQSNAAGSGGVFQASARWIRKCLGMLGQSYKRTTNDPGKLPLDWAERVEEMKVRLAFLVFKRGVPRKLVVNMDETPLMVVPRHGSTWGKKGKRSQAPGATDKRQLTATPWLNADGELVLFHTTFKGKTDRCLPSPQCRGKSCFKEPVPFAFGFSKNHWVSKETMRQQVQAMETYRCQVIADDPALKDDQYMIVIWDVYCRHRDGDLFTWMRKTFVYIIVLFVPANMTEICQPLDVYFNAPLKTRMADKMSGYLLKQASDFMEQQQATGDNAVFKPNLRWSALKEPLMVMLAEVVADLREPQMVRKLKEEAWSLFEPCFQQDYQWDAVSKVSSDSDGKYFKVDCDTGRALGLQSSPTVLQAIDVLAQSSPDHGLEQLKDRKATIVIGV